MSTLWIKQKLTYQLRLMIYLPLLPVSSSVSLSLPLIATVKYAIIYCQIVPASIRKEYVNCNNCNNYNKHWFMFDCPHFLRHLDKVVIRTITKATSTTTKNKQQKIKVAVELFALPFAAFLLQFYDNILSVQCSLYTVYQIRSFLFAFQFAIIYICIYKAERIEKWS